MARAQARAMEGMITSLTDGVVFADLDGEFLIFNPAAELMLGIGLRRVSLEEISTTYGVFLPDRVTRCPTEQLPLVRAIRGETVQDVEMFIRGPHRPDGMMLSVTGLPWLSPAGERLGGIVILTVPTLADSNTSGFHRAVLFVRAATAMPGIFHDSPADSGYSVDNLPPIPPAPFTAAYASGATNLHWGANAEADLWYYKLHRGSSAGFTPGPGNLIATLADTGYVDVGPAGSYYKLAAVRSGARSSRGPRRIGIPFLAPARAQAPANGSATAFDHQRGTATGFAKVARFKPARPPKSLSRNAPLAATAAKL